jgi:hypothetical protein
MIPNPMLNKTFPAASAIIAMAASLLLLASCSSKKPVVTASTPVSNGAAYANQSGFGGQIAVFTTSTNATVISISASEKKMELKLPDGTVSNYDVDPDVIDLEHVKIGDDVKVVTAEERAVFMGRDVAAAADGSAPTTISMPVGSSSVVRNTTNKTYQAKVTAIDAWNNAVTLKLSDGQIKTVKVRPTFNLADVSVGDDVSIRISQATVVMMDKP